MWLEALPACFLLVEPILLRSLPDCYLLELAARRGRKSWPSAGRMCTRTMDVLMACRAEPSTSSSVRLLTADPLIPVIRAVCQRLKASSPKVMRR